MPRYKDGRKKAAASGDVWVVNDAGRVVAVAPDHPCVPKAKKGEAGWRVATEEEAKAQAAEDAAKADRDKLRMAEEVEERRKVRLAIEASKDVGKERRGTAKSLASPEGDDK